MDLNIVNDQINLQDPESVQEIIRKMKEINKTQIEKKKKVELTLPGIRYSPISNASTLLRAFTYHVK
jgi:hypothetical protein